MGVKSPYQISFPEMRFCPYTMGMACPYAAVCTRSVCSTVGCCDMGRLGKNSDIRKIVEDRRTTEDRVIGKLSNLVIECQTRYAFQFPNYTIAQLHNYSIIQFPCWYLRMTLPSQRKESLSSSDQHAILLAIRQDHAMLHYRMNDERPIEDDRAMAPGPPELVQHKIRSRCGNGERSYFRSAR